MRKFLLIILLALCSFNIGAQNRPSVVYHTVGKTYDATALVSVDGVIYKALSTTSTTPPDASWVLVADQAIVENIVSPLDPYFGTKVQPTQANSGFYATSSFNGATGYLANLTSTGNFAYTGLHLVNNGNEFVDETTFLHYGSNYYIPRYQNNGSAYFTNDFYFTGAKNSSNIIFELGTSASATNNAQYDVFRLNADSTITFPALTNALINSGGDQSPITLKYFNDNSAGGAFEALDEGNGIGYVVSGRDASLFGNVGLGSFDVSTGSGASSTRGPTGAQSFTSGLATTASGIQSVALGRLCNAAGDWSFAMGNTNNATGRSSVALGQDTNANGFYAFASGFGSDAIGDWSVAFGNNSHSNGRGSFTVNYDNFANSYAESGLGSFNTDYTPANATAFDASDRLLNVGNGTSNGARSDAFTILKNANVGIDIDNFEANDTGEKLQVNGLIKSDASNVEIDAGADETVPNKRWVLANAGGGAFEVIDEGNGDGIIVSGRIATNYGNIGLQARNLSFSNSSSTTRGATGNYSFTTGLNTQASGIYSVALGLNSRATNNYSFAAGFNTDANGRSSTALGENTNAVGNRSFAVGDGADANGFITFAEGLDTAANGEASHAQGRNTTSNGNYSFVSGYGGTAGSYVETVMGIFPTSVVGNTAGFTLTDRLFTLGNGTSGAALSDALTVLKNGNIALGINNFEANDTGHKLQVEGSLRVEGAIYDVKDDLTTSYTLILTDINDIVTTSNAGFGSLNIPTNASVAFPIGTVIKYINKGAGTFDVAGAGVTILAEVGLSVPTGGVRTLYKIDTDTWAVGN